ncbi:MAG: DUF4874 domain-containing protein, partial [Bdellovibrionia bacterium]
MSKLKNVGLKIGLIGLGAISSLDAMALTAPTASNDSTNIYYKLSYSGSPTQFQFYLDTDANAGTGYSISGIGANYLIESGNLYKFSGSSSTTWGWTFVKAITWSATNGVANASLLKTDLGSPSKILLLARVSSPLDTSAVVTEVISSVVASPTPAPTSISSPVITSDALNASIKFTYSGASGVYDDAFIDVDSNASSGYSINGIGAEYLLENGNLYRFSGSSSTTWGWTSVKAISFTGTSGSASFTVARADIGSPSAIRVVGQAQTPSVVSAAVSATLTAVAPSPSPTASPSPNPTSGTANWVNCAVENGTCSFSGTHMVRYGANGKYYTGVYTNSVLCANSVFGDPLVGTAKSCAVDLGSSPTPSPTVTVGPLPTPSPTVTVGPSPSPTPTVTVTPAPTASPSQVNYSASSANIVNPERGFDWMTDCRANPISVSQMQNYRATNGHSVIHCMWYLRDFKSSPITSTVLSQLSTQLDSVRAAGFKMILRFAYTNTDTVDAPLSVVQGHLDQMAPILQKNSDIIATVQTGIVGQWGEQQASSNYGDPNTS